MITNPSQKDFSTFDLSDFEYIDERNSKRVLGNVVFDLFRVLPRKISGIDWRLSPIHLPRKEWDVEIKTIGEAIGFCTPVQSEALAFHQSRLNRMRKIIMGSYYPLGLLFIIPFIVFIYFYQTILFHTINSATISLLIPITFLYAFVSVGIAMRLSYGVVSRYFIYSLCIQTMIFLIVELARCNNPLTPSQKNQLLIRTGFLVKTTRSIASSYHLDIVNENWVRNHFLQIEKYIQEREKWIIAPQDQTLGTLQQDFYQLALMFIDGNFGNFEYSPETSQVKVPSGKKYLDFIFSALRVAIGTFMPIAGVVVIATNPDLVNHFIDVKVLALICVGWLLLAIDAILKLGIIAGVIGIAKGIKDLS